jgi:hypothetical protein
MSISNSTRAIAHVSITSALFGQSDSHYTRRIGQVEGKEHAYRKADKKVQEASKKSPNDGKNYSSAAQEIYNKVSNTFNELVDLTNQRLSPLAFASINSAPHSKFNNVDLKRHQNYFNQMMNHDTPSGSWIDKSV